MGLTRGRKAGYGAAEFGLAGGELLLQLYLLEFYIRGVGLSPMAAGIALGLAILWDAVTDPVMGGIVDRTHSRWGRFIPYLLVGALLFAGGLVVLFNPPAMESQAAIFLYLLFSYLWVNTGLTIIGVPHIAMGGVLSSDTHERTELYGWRLVFGTFGLFAGILVPLVAALAVGADVKTGTGLLSSRGLGSLLMGLMILLFSGITIMATRKISTTIQANMAVFKWADFFRNAGQILRNPVFLPFFLAFLLVAMGRTMNSTLALPYYKDSLDFSEAMIQGPILTLFTVSIVLSVPAWVWLGRRYGKRDPAFAGMLILGLMTAIAYPLFPPGSLIGPMMAAVIGGFAVGAIVLVESLVTDIADEHFVRSGEDQEGIYFGFWRMGQKVARSVTLGLTGLLLSAIGYKESVLEQSGSTDRALAWVFGLGVGSLFIAASLVFRWVPITRERQELIQREKQAILRGEQRS